MSNPTPSKEPNKHLYIPCAKYARISPKPPTRPPFVTYVEDTPAPSKGQDLGPGGSALLPKQSPVPLSVDEILTQFKRQVQGESIGAGYENTKSALLAHALSCLPEKDTWIANNYESDEIGEHAMAEQYAWNAALDLMEQSLRKGYE